LAIAAEEKVIDIKFSKPSGSGSDMQLTMQSIVKVQGTGGLCQDGLYLITHYGDREELFEKENQRLIDHPYINDTWKFCSIFSVDTGKDIIFGRNWDNQNVGHIIISYYKPAKGYSSISFTRAIDMGYPMNMDLEGIGESPFAGKLMLAPFFTHDGINEHGLTVSVAGIGFEQIKPIEGKKMIFSSYLLRKILDKTKTVEEASKFVDDYIPFLLDKGILAGHFMVADASGKSVILEYKDGGWKKIFNTNKEFQVLTNKVVHDVPTAKLKEKCWRYAGISKALEGDTGLIDWKAGLKILQNAHQKGTTWSVVYSLKSRELYFSVYQDWATVYHLKFPE
jgi:hypothetical protein